MSAEFNPYHKWLGIPLKHQPPNHYRLLGIEIFESDPEVIGGAATQRRTYLEGLAKEHAEWAERLLQEVATARSCLLDPDRKVAYDAKLQARLQATTKAPAPLTGETEPAEAGAGKPDRQERANISADVEPPPPPAVKAPPLPPLFAAASPMPVATPVLRPVPPIASGSAPDSPGAPVISEGPPPVVGPAPPSPGIAPVIQLQPRPAPSSTRHGRAGGVGRVTTGRVTPAARRPSPMLRWAIVSAAAALLAGAIFFAAKYWPAEQTPVQTADRSSTRERVPRVPTPDSQPSSGTAKAKDQPEPFADDGFEVAAPVTKSGPAKPRFYNQRPLLQGDAIAEAMVALGSGELDAASARLRQALDSGDEQSREQARQLLREIELASSEDHAQEMLWQLSPEQLARLAQGEMPTQLEEMFENPLLRERFAQRLRAGAEAAVGRRTPESDRPTTSPSAPAAKSKPSSEATKPPAADPSRSDPDNPFGDAAIRVEDAAAKPTEMNRDAARPLSERGLVRKGNYWLLEHDDELQEGTAQVGRTVEPYREAGAALLEATNALAQAQTRVSEAQRTGGADAVEAAQRGVPAVQRAYDETLRRYMTARSRLTVAFVRAQRQAEELAARYRELAEEADVQQGSSGPNASEAKLGPTPAFQENQRRLNELADDLLTNKSLGYWSREEEGIFYTDVIVNERTSAVFSLRPQYDVNLISEQVAREAGLTIDADQKRDLKIGNVACRVSRVTIPALRIGRFVSRNIEAYVLPPDVKGLENSLTHSAFPEIRLSVDSGENVLTVTPAQQE